MKARKRMNRLATTVAAATIASLTPLASADLIGQWLFEQNLDESSGFKADGVHDGIADGTIAYSTDAAPGSGYSLDLTAASSAVLVQNSNFKVDGSAGGADNGSYQGTYDADIASGPFTVSAWVKGNPATWTPLVANKGEACCGYQLRKRSSSDHAAFTLRGTGGDPDPEGAIDINDGSWHHVVGVFDSANSNRLLYVDGVLDTAGSIQDGSDTGSVAAATFEYLVFGARDHGGSISGHSGVLLDDVRIYNHVVSESHIDGIVAGNQVVFGADDRLTNLNGLKGTVTEGLRMRENNAYGAFPSPTNINDGEASLLQKEFNSDVVSIQSSINFSSDGGGPGFITGDAAFPHDPGGDDNVLEISGVLRIEEAGQYVFGVNSDDGFRLRMGNDLATVSEFVGTAGNSNTHVELSFTEAGYYAYRLTHFEAGGGQHLEFYAKNGSNDFYEAGIDQLIGDTANGGLQAIANGQFQLRLVQSAGTAITSLALAEGLLDGSVANSGVFTGFADTIDFYDGSGGSGNVAGGTAFLNGATTDFALLATGKMLVTESSLYTFLTNIDDGAGLWIDGVDVFGPAADRTGATDDFVGEIFLEAGVHDIRYLFFERTGGGSAELFVAKGSQGDYGPTTEAFYELVNDIGNGSLAVFAVPTPAALPAGLMLMLATAARRRRK